MLEFQIKNLIKAKGLKSPYKKFRAAGMGYSAAQGYITGKSKKLNNAHAEILCTLLKITPDQLYAWTPDQPADDRPDHPLYPLKKKPLLNVEEALSKMSPEEIERRLGG